LTVPQWKSKRGGESGGSFGSPNEQELGFFLWVLIGISYDLQTFGIQEAFSYVIRPRNAVGLQLGIKLTHYSG